MEIGGLAARALGGRGWGGAKNPVSRGQICTHKIKFSDTSYPVAGVRKLLSGTRVYNLTSLHDQSGVNRVGVWRITHTGLTC